MSHTSTVRAIKIVSIPALRSAIEELKAGGLRCSFVENEIPRGYFANQAGLEKAPYVLKLEDSRYDIGFYKAADGSYEARTDLFGNDINRLLGVKTTDPTKREQAQMGKLFQLYGVAAATEAARRQGHSVRRVTDATTGKIKLEITGAGL